MLCPCHPPSFYVKYKCLDVQSKHITRHPRKSRLQKAAPSILHRNFLQLSRLPSLSIQFELFDTMDRIPGRPTSFIRGGVKNSSTIRRAPVQFEQVLVPIIRSLRGHSCHLHVI